MTVRIDTLETDVTVDAANTATPEAAQQGANWEEQAKLAAMRARAARDDLRTRACGYDD